jgi:hypothetical protein
MRAAFVTLVLLATGCARQLVGSQCTTRWELPQILEAPDGRPAYVESPNALSTRSGILLLGVPAFLWAERDAFDPAPTSNGLDTVAYLTRLRANHGLIGFVFGPKRTATPVRAPFAGLMRRLVAVLGPDGTIHTAWFAPPSGSNDSDIDGVVWYAERHNDQWTEPTIVFSADRLDWSGERVALLVSHPSEIHLVVSFRRGQTAGVAYIRRINGRWKTTETPLRGLPSQASAQLIGNDSLAVAFAAIGAPNVRVRNGQHIYMIRAALSDTVWPGPTLVDWSGLDAIRWLRLHRVPSPVSRSTALALVWNRIPRESRASADTIFAMLSEDGGVTWNKRDQLPLSFKVATLTQDRDTRGSVHIAITSLGGSNLENTHMYHAALTNGKWTDIDSVRTGSVASEPTLSAIEPDTLLLVWGNTRPADKKLSGVIAPVSKYAAFTKGCQRRVRP